MDALSALREAISHSGISKYALSKKLGKVPAYLGSLFSRGSIPKTDTYALIADAAGYDLILRNRSDGTEITIETLNDDK